MSLHLVSCFNLHRFKSDHNGRVVKQYKQVLSVAINYMCGIRYNHSVK